MRIYYLFVLLLFVTACEVPSDYDSQRSYGRTAQDSGAGYSDEGAYAEEDTYGDEGAYDDEGAYGDEEAYSDDYMSDEGEGYGDAVTAEKVLFDFDSSALDAQDRQVIQEVASWMEQNPGSEVLIEGHADERGTREYNLALGERRATSVKNYLQSLGISASRIRTTSYGKERPAVSGSNPDAWRQNRRAEIKVY